MEHIPTPKRQIIHKARTGSGWVIFLECGHADNWLKGSSAKSTYCFQCFKGKPPFLFPEEIERYKRNAK